MQSFGTELSFFIFKYAGSTLICSDIQVQNSNSFGVLSFFQRSVHTIFDFFFQSEVKLALFSSDFRNTRIVTRAINE